MTEPLRDIYLYGSLRKQFGGHYRLSVRDAAEAVRALSFLFKGFREALSAGAWEVIRGPRENGFRLDEDTLRLGLGKCALHLVPAPIGAQGRAGGVGKIVIGVALVAAAFIFAPAAGAGAGFLGADLGATAFSALGASFTFGQIALLGAAMTLSGIASLVAPSPKTNIGQTVAQNPSYLLTGPQNTSTEGLCVPVVYGDVLVGSIVGAVTLTTVDFAQNPSSTEGFSAVTGKIGTHVA
jgi:predicted phage tail protein